MKLKIRILSLLFTLYVVQVQTQTTLKICDVKKAKDTLKTHSYQEAIKIYTLSRVDEAESQELHHPPKIQAHSEGKGRLITGKFNPLLQAVYLAYQDHRPLVLSPDMIWLSLTQGFALHINENGEELRDKLVHFKGKKQIKINGGSSMQALGNKGWVKLLPKFEDKIAKHVGKDLISLVNAKFSTTQLNETVAFQITLMDALSEYFAYSAVFKCGIPEIILEGSPEDWKAIEQKIQTFEKYELSWWIQELKPILKEFSSASEGNINTEFWEAIFQINTIDRMCAHQHYVTGWITKLFPYIGYGEEYVRNPMLKISLDNIILRKDSEELAFGYELPQLETKHFPSGISKAEILCDDNGSFYDMQFYAGFMGIRQDEKTLALRPEISWLVYDTGKKPDNKRIEDYLKAGESD